MSDLLVYKISVPHLFGATRGCASGATQNFPLEMVTTKSDNDREREQERKSTMCYVQTYWKKRKIGRENRYSKSNKKVTVR